VEETKFLTMENTRKDYKILYVTCGVLDGVWQTRDTGINDNKFPLSLICPQFICESSFEFFWLLPSQKDVLLTFML
jgi:hypothetical protein